MNKKIYRDRATLSTEAISSSVFSALLPVKGEAANRPLSRFEMRGAAQTGGEGISHLGANRLSVPVDWNSIEDEIGKFPIPREIWEVAVEIVDSSDVVGMERSVLEFLIRFVIWTDRKAGSA